MTESSMVWGGTATGDAAAGNFTAPYSDDEFSDMLAMILTYDRTTQGVIRSARTGYSGNLAVTNPAGVTIRVATGLALVDGKLYANSANVDNVVVAPGGGSNFYRIVLRKDFAAQTVRIALIGPDIAAFPAVTQTDGTTWEISLAGIEITSASAITITDERDYAIIVDTGNIADDAVTGDKIADNSIVPDQIVNRTRAFLVQAVEAYDMTGSATVPRPGNAVVSAFVLGPAGWPLENNSITRCYANFYVPSDFVSDMTITMIVMHSDYSGALGGATSDAVFRMYTYYGALDSTGATHSESIGATTVALQKGQLLEAVLSDAITDAAVGDFVSVEGWREGSAAADTCDSTYFALVGFLVSYTADS